MDINKFTEKLQEALSSAQTEAVRHGHQQVDVEHLLLALLVQDGGLATSILNKANVDVERLRGQTCPATTYLANQVLRTQ